MNTKKRLILGTGISALIFMIALPPRANAQTSTQSVPSVEDDSPPATNGALSTTLQPTAENGRQVYGAAQFARFNPRTALDMVRQVPGFTIDTGDEDERGLGQADENVLINGARIAGKNTDAFTALSRISASSVQRIEILDGATLSISGLSGQVLNLVAKSDTAGGISGNFKWEPRWRRSGNNWLEGEASISGKLGKTDVTLAIENGSFRNGAEGAEQITDGSGLLLFERDEIARNQADRPILSATFARTSEAGAIFNASLTGALNHFSQRVESHRTQAGEADVTELFTGQEREWNVELSADYEFELGRGRLKLIGLQRFEHSPFQDFFGQTFSDGMTPANGSQFDRTVDEGESVLRAEYNWKTSGGTDWGINLEGAYNFLDSEASLNSVSLPDSDSKVTEYRGELIGSYGRALNDNLTLQATLGGEYSQISQSGTRGETRSFVRPKGSVSFAWRPEDGLDLSLKLERTVGQLNFSDFVASIDVVSNANNAGNPGLVPPQTWRAELETTQKLGPWGSMTINIYGEKISDIVDSIPITPTTEARGNLSSATRYGVELTSSILFDSIGWRGAKLDIEGEIRKSNLTDPLTGVSRRINDDKIFTYEVSLRHDVPGSDWAWGFGAEDFRFSDFLRLDQINSFQTRAPFAWIFVEHKDVFGLTVNATLNNVFNQGERFTRTAFGQFDTPDGTYGNALDGFIRGRRNGAVGFVEDRTRKFGLVYRLTVSGSF
ncbi:TonB-dependent receptor plug domain-containing protein [Parasphingorhabdus sp.]|uniref:TonB-dependent receptor plug domain-containing protein n=1 Tax=Parasphingorhabdus sp. TaxID=2709688 RepID=UPI0032671A74